MHQILARHGMRIHHYRPPQTPSPPPSLSAINTHPTACNKSVFSRCADRWGAASRTKPLLLLLLPPLLLLLLLLLLLPLLLLLLPAMTAAPSPPPSPPSHRPTHGSNSRPAASCCSVPPRPWLLLCINISTNMCTTTTSSSSSSSATVAAAAEPRCRWESASTARWWQRWRSGPATRPSRLRSCSACGRSSGTRVSRAAQRCGRPSAPPSAWPWWQTPASATCRPPSPSSMLLGSRCLPVCPCSACPAYPPILLAGPDGSWG